MVFNEIEKLIERYENAETSLKEEEKLRQYFAQDEIDPRHEVYRPMFAYFSKTQTEEFSKELPLGGGRRIRLYQWLAVAAVAVIMFGLLITNPLSNKERTYADLSPEEQQTYDEAILALNMLGANFKKGTDNLNAMNHVSDAFERGQQDLARLTEFDRTTDKIFKYE